MKDSCMAIGVSFVSLERMNKGTAYKFGLLKEKDKPGYPSEEIEDGYRIDYGDYVSWIPKDKADSKYFPIEDGTKISKADVDAFIVKGEGHRLGAKTCVVIDSTITGFDTTATSACVDPANYNQEIGEEIARKDIVDKIWGHLGFVLQWAKNGLKFHDKVADGDDNHAI